MGYTHFSGVDAATFKIDGTQVTATAAELNYNDVTTAGTAQASKALVTDANIDISGIRNVGLTGTLTLSTNQDVKAAQTSGTTLTSLLVTPKASATTTSINYHKLFAIGDITGNTAFGMGDPAKPTVGLMASFGRTALATGTFTDTALDVRVINKLVDNTGVHSIQGGYIKAKNYSGATLTGSVIGLFVEAVADGTVSGTASTVLKLGTDGTRVPALIDASSALMTLYDSNTKVVLLKFVDAAGTTQYLVHDTDSGNAVSVASSVS